jgi:hypothetical protein
MGKGRGNGRVVGVIPGCGNPVGNLDVLGYLAHHVSGVGALCYLRKESWGGGGSYLYIFRNLPNAVTGAGSWR